MGSGSLEVNDGTAARVKAFYNVEKESVFAMAGSPMLLPVEVLVEPPYDYVVYPENGGVAVRAFPV